MSQKVILSLTVVGCIVSACDQSDYSPRISKGCELYSGEVPYDLRNVYFTKFDEIYDIVEKDSYESRSLKRFDCGSEWMLFEPVPEGFFGGTLYLRVNKKTMKVVEGHAFQ